MKETDEAFGMGLDRLNAMLGWWGVPHWNGTGDIEGHIKRFHIFASNLQKNYGEAHRQQIDTLFTTNERLTASFQGLLRCKEPGDAVAAESEILATLLAGASRQAKTWAELAQKVHDCCTAMTREAVEEVRGNAKDEGGPTPLARSGRSPTKEVNGHPTRN